MLSSPAPVHFFGKSQEFWGKKESKNSKTIQISVPQSSHSSGILDFYSFTYKNHSFFYATYIEIAHTVLIKGDERMRKMPSPSLGS